jgi:L-lactate dehydrogenase complex protein LldG
MQTNKTSSRSRENILRRIREGLKNSPLPMPFPEIQHDSMEMTLVAPNQGLEEQFAETFIRLGGKFIFCNNEQEMMQDFEILYDQREWRQVLCADARLLETFHSNKLDYIQQANPYLGGGDACITGCEMLVARTGSVLLSSRQFMGRVAPVYFPVHIVVAYASQVVADIQQGLSRLQEHYGNELPSMINLNTGPSRTADIEKTLVVGVHGPKEVFCFLINDLEYDPIARLTN